METKIMMEHYQNKNHKKKSKKKKNKQLSMVLGYRCVSASPFDLFKYTFILLYIVK